MSSKDKVQSILKEVAAMFGIENFKEKLEKVILSIVNGNDTFVSLPTGYGKSVVYAALPVLFDRLHSKRGSIVVCVSPLTSLMIEQCEKFTTTSLSTELLGEAQMSKEATYRMERGEVQLVYISPESIICNPRYRGMLISDVFKENLVALAVDEAHCVKTW